MEEKRILPYVTEDICKKVLVEEVRLGENYGLSKLEIIEYKNPRIYSFLKSLMRRKRFINPGVSIYDALNKAGKIPEVREEALGDVFKEMDDRNREGFINYVLGKIEEQKNENLVKMTYFLNEKYSSYVFDDCFLMYRLIERQAEIEHSKRL